MVQNLRRQQSIQDIGFDFIRGHWYNCSYSTEEALLQKSKSMTLYAIECNLRTTNGLDILSLKHEKVIWQAYMRFLGEILMKRMQKALPQMRNSM